MATEDRFATEIVVANLNRAREALRAMEDYARFVLHDAGLSSDVEETKHALEACVPDELGKTLTARVDFVGELGREVGTAGEDARSDAAHVALEAQKRLGEALVVIEQHAPAIQPAFTTEITKIRRRNEEFQRRLSRTIIARERFGHGRLYVLLTESLCRGDWFATAQAALDGGADCLQLREKGLPDRELLDRATRLVRLCHDLGALFIVNDRPDIAVLSGADGVHVGQDDLPVAQVRRIVPSTVIVGTSTHTPEQLAAAAVAAPDYIAVGPMFSTSTKPQGHIAGPQTLAAARHHTSLPLVAIGGIDEDNAPEVLTAAPCCLCVCGAIISQPDVTTAASRLRACIDRVASEPSPQDATEDQADV